MPCILECCREPTEIVGFGNQNFVAFGWSPKSIDLHEAFRYLGAFDDASILVQIIWVDHAEAAVTVAEPMSIYGKSR